MLRLVIVHDQTSVNDAGDPAEQRKEKTQDETEDAAGHQHGNGREDNAKEVAQGFQAKPASEIGDQKSNLARSGHADSGIGFFQGRTSFGLA